MTVSSSGGVHYNMAFYGDYTPETIFPNRRVPHNTTSRGEPPIAGTVLFGQLPLAVMVRTRSLPASCASRKPPSHSISFPAVIAPLTFCSSWHLRGDWDPLFVLIRVWWQIAHTLTKTISSLHHLSAIDISLPLSAVSHHSCLYLY